MCVGAEDVLAEVARLARLGERGVEHVGLVRVLAADEDERLVGADRVGADDHPLDEQMRVLLHQLAVLERAGLGLVGVADEVLVHRPLGDEGHLLAHREAGAAAAADARVEHLLQHVLPGPSRAPCAASRSRRAASSRRAWPARGRRCSRRGGSCVPVRSPPSGASSAACRAAPRGPPSRRPRSARSRPRSSGPTYSPSTDAIGAMSHAPRHSNLVTWKSGSSPAALSIAS